VYPPSKLPSAASPAQLKIIQARLFAQAGLIGLAVTLALVTVLTEDEQAVGPATSSWKLRSFEPVAAAPATGMAGSPAAARTEAAAAPASPQLK
jgi:hypothetical protein